MARFGRHGGDAMKLAVVRFCGAVVLSGQLDPDVFDKPVKAVREYAEHQDRQAHQRGGQDNPINADGAVLVTEEFLEMAAHTYPMNRCALAWH